MIFQDCLFYSKGTDLKHVLIKLFITFLADIFFDDQHEVLVVLESFYFK